MSIITDVRLRADTYADQTPALVLEFKLDGVDMMIDALWPETRGLGIFKPGTPELLAAIFKGFAKAIEENQAREAA